MDHGFGAGAEGLVVAGEAPVEREPSETSLRRDLALLEYPGLEWQ